MEMILITLCFLGFFLPFSLLSHILEPVEMRNLVVAETFLGSKQTFVGSNSISCKFEVA